MTTRREANLALLAGAFFAAAPAAILAQTAPLELPPPRADGGKPLFQALKSRRSIREFSQRAVPPGVLSDLLWAAFGINRPQSADRTAPSWRHALEIDVYVATTEGVSRFVPEGHSLAPVTRADIRAKTGKQNFVAVAPLTLIYVADGSRMGDVSRDEQRLWAFTDTGFIGQNVYLFCASEGLATVFRGSIDREDLLTALQLKPSQFVTCVQTVGYPKA